MSFPSSAWTDILFRICCVDGKDEAPVHVLHSCGLLLGMRVKVLWSLTQRLAQASNFNSLRSYSRIWACLLGGTGMLTSLPLGAYRGEDGNHGYTQKGSLQP